MAGKARSEPDSYYNLKPDIVDMISKQGAERRRQILTHRRVPLVSSSSTARAPSVFADTYLDTVDERTSEPAASDSSTESDDWGTESVVTTRQFDPVDTSEGGAGRRHGGYGLVTFSSEDEQTAWHDHPSTFTRESLMFAMLFSHKGKHEGDEDPCKKLGNLERINYRPFLHFKLKGITDTDFESFLLALRPRLGQPLPAKRLPAVLVLATKWDFPNLRNYALTEIPNHLPALLTPTDTIVLAREAVVPQWLLDPHIQLATRPGPLSLEEARIVGIDAMMAISKARERILAKRLSLIIGPPPVTLLGYALWTHTKCWATLSDAWRIALTDKKYRDSFKTTKETIAAVLDDSKLAYAEDNKTIIGRFVQTVTLSGDPPSTANLPRIGKLCSSCDDLSKIEGWIAAREDEKTAKRILRDVLSEEDWVKL